MKSTLFLQNLQPTKKKDADDIQYFRIWKKNNSL